MKEIDARGLSCPAPVLQTKAELDESNPDEIKIIVDNEASRENVSRFLESRHYETIVSEADGDFAIVGKKAEGAAADETPAPATAPGAAEERNRIMVLVATDIMGRGDDELGSKLMVNFIKTLKEMGPELWHLVFVNGGVKLTVEGSQVLSELKEYADDGLKILVCGTCLTHFDLLDKKEVGETTNMLDIVMAMQLADKVINI